jgi:DNA-binding MurR/RpiR family transcriptional regulator
MRYYNTILVIRTNQAQKEAIKRIANETGMSVAAVTRGLVGMGLEDILGTTDV